MEAVTVSGADAVEAFMSGLPGLRRARRRSGGQAAKAALPLCGKLLKNQNKKRVFATVPGWFPGAESAI
jgi:hypothetical protein